MFQTIRGTQDILPEEQGYWDLVRDRASSLCRCYGYQRIDTPVFEQTALFERGVGQGTDIVEKEMYSFEDHGGEKLTLRPEGTAPVCRAYVQQGMSSLPQPVKLFYFAPIFRYERPQAGRFRQHHQFGCEAIGEIDPALDAEVIELAYRLNLSLGLSSLSLYINSIGCRKCRPKYIETLEQYFSACTGQLCVDCKSRLKRNTLRLLDCKNPSCRQIADSAPRITDFLCGECASHFEKLRRNLDLMGISYRLNHCLVRGLDYYTRTVFEIQPGEEGGAQSTISGGGRYDNLIEELGGRPTPAIGFATGIERIILNLKKQNIAPPSVEKVRFYLAYLGTEAKEELLKLTAGLRAASIPAILSMGDRSLKAQLKSANAVGARYVVIMGDDEFKKGIIVLRDMAASQQSEIIMESALETMVNLK